MSIEAMKQALEALELMYACYAHPEWVSHKQQEDKILAQCAATIMTLRQAIAEAEMMQAAAQGREIKLAMAEANDKRLEAEKQEHGEPVAYTTGHCKEKAKAGGCQLHNIQCGFPDCDRKST